MLFILFTLDSERYVIDAAQVRYPHAGTVRLLALLLEGATRTIRLAAEAFHDAGIDMPHARYLGPVASEAGSLVQWIRVEHLLPDDVKALLFPEAHA
jgi:chemotaxis-related protein WspB